MLQRHVILDAVLELIGVVPQLHQEEPGVCVELLQVGILVGDDLRQEPVEAAEARELALESVLRVLVVEGLVALDALSTVALIFWWFPAVGS